jgi:hypothetical protein
VGSSSNETYCVLKDPGGCAVSGPMLCSTKGGFGKTIRSLLTSIKMLAPNRTHPYLLKTLRGLVSMVSYPLSLLVMNSTYTYFKPIFVIFGRFNLEALVIFDVRVKHRAVAHSKLEFLG